MGAEECKAALRAEEPARGRRLAKAIGRLIALLAAMAVLRLPLLREPALRLGWNSDTAIYGLIAKRMVDERCPVFLFLGQDYLGTLTSFWTVAVGMFVGGVGPLALRIAALLQVGIAIWLLWDTMERAWGRMAATIAAIWLAAAPRWFFEMTYAPLSAEQMFFMGALILWYASRQPLHSTTRWLGFGALAGLGWWAHRGSMFAVVAAVIGFMAFDRPWRDRTGMVKGLVAATVGFAAGCVPLFLGHLQVDQQLYTPVALSWAPDRVMDRLREFWVVDFWTFTGADGGALAWAATGVLLLLATAGFTNLRRGRECIMLIGLAVVTLCFWVGSMHAYSGATRYLMLALPPLYGVAAAGAVELASRGRTARVLVFGSVALITAHLYFGRMSDVRSVAEGGRENHYRWKSVDPRPVLAAIEQQGYSVCYADFWVAYKLEWLSGGKVKFIPYKSVNRTQRRSRQLVSMPVPKCFVGADATVRPVTAEEEAQVRAVLWSDARGAAGGAR